MGAGARALLHVAVGRELYAAARIARSGRTRTKGRTAYRALRQGDVYLHGICILPAVAGGRAGSGAAVCESGRESLGVGRSSFGEQMDSTLPFLYRQKAGPSLRSA